MVGVAGSPKQIKSAASPEQTPTNYAFPNLELLPRLTIRVHVWINHPFKIPDIVKQNLVEFLRLEFGLQQDEENSKTKSTATAAGAKKHDLEDGEKVKAASPAKKQDWGDDKKEVPKTGVRVKAVAAEEEATAEQPKQQDGNKPQHITNKKFANLPHISSESRRALSEVFKYEFMTSVQAETLPLILHDDKKDCLAKAKTGTIWFYCCLLVLMM